MAYHDFHGPQLLQWVMKAFEEGWYVIIIVYNSYSLNSRTGIPFTGFYVGPITPKALVTDWTPVGRDGLMALSLTSHRQTAINFHVDAQGQSLPRPSYLPILDLTPLLDPKWDDM